MILRRIAHAIRHQDWFTVVIEVMIVVLGVFIGLQVNNWNDLSKDRARERDYIERLHGDVVLLERVRQPLVGLREESLAELYRASRYVMGTDEAPITSRECLKIAFSNVITNPTDDLAVVSELISAGELDIFSTPALGKALAEFLSARARAADARVVGPGELAPVRGRYPEEIRPVTLAAPDLSSPGFDVSFACDSVALRENAAFIADLIGNLQYYGMHVQQNRLVSDRLSSLHTVLDDILGVTHVKETM